MSDFFNILLLVEMETVDLWYMHSFQNKSCVSGINYLEY